MKWWIALAVTGFAFAAQAGEPLPFAAVGEISGVARAGDGDDVFIKDIDVRLQGIAAPEIGTVAGQAAAKKLRGMVDGQAARCVLDGTMTRGRVVGVCFVGEMEVNAGLVAAGVARDCPHFSGGRYADEEAAARAAGKDLSAIYPLPNYC